MTGFPLIIAFIIAVILMIVAISKFKIHPFLSIMGVSLILGLVAGIPLVDVKDANGAGHVAGIGERHRRGLFRDVYKHRYRDHPGRADRQHPGGDRRGVQAGGSGD